VELQEPLWPYYRLLGHNEEQPQMFRCAQHDSAVGNLFSCGRITGYSAITSPSTRADEGDRRESKDLLFISVPPQTSTSHWKFPTPAQIPAASTQFHDLLGFSKKTGLAFPNPHI
jgi:hypothetical protein